MRYTAILKPNRFTISLSDETYQLLQDYSDLTGHSKSTLIDNWIYDRMGDHRANMKHIEQILTEEATAKG